MFRFPFTNFHELNLDWILSVVKQFSELIPPMQSAVTNIQEALSDATEAVNKSEEALESANTALNTANDAKDIAEQAAQGVITDGAVTTTKIANGAVTYNKLGDSAVGTDKITNGAVTTEKLADSSVTTAKIVNGAVTKEKLASSIAIQLNTDIMTTSGIIPIPTEGQSSTHTLTGLTAAHVVAFWGFSESEENNPPCDIEISTGTNSFTVTNTRGNTNESIKPVFIRPKTA